MALQTSSIDRATAIDLQRGLFAGRPGARLLRQEFGFFSIEAWHEQGLPADFDLDQYFAFDPSPRHGVMELGWVAAEMVPGFPEHTVEVRDQTEVIQDRVGRHLLVFRGRRRGFMPEYLRHPVRDQRSWEEDVCWRLDPTTPERITRLDAAIEAAARDAIEGAWMVQHVIGGYMYLRSLVGPEELLYLVYDQPELLHALMRQWLALAEAVTSRVQARVECDEVFFAEDICYNHGPLISPDMMSEFLFPYYQQLLTGMRSRQARRLHIHVDTDGFCDPVIPLYRSAIGLDAMSPFEVASGCDVVRSGREWPDLVIRGGIDKRILAAGPQAIDAELARILPLMRERGGYIPTCDHGVPPEVPLAHYLHYRRQAVALGG